MHKCHGPDCRLRHPEKYNQEEKEHLKQLFDIFTRKNSNLSAIELLNDFKEKQFDILSSFQDNISLVAREKKKCIMSYGGTYDDSNNLISDHDLFEEGNDKDIYHIMKKMNGIFFCDNCQINIHDYKCQAPSCNCKKCNSFIKSRWK